MTRQMATKICVICVAGLGLSSCSDGDVRAPQHVVTAEPVGVSRSVTVDGDEISTVQMSTRVNGCTLPCGEIDNNQKIPNVLIVADASQSMFQPLTGGSAATIWSTFQPQMLSLVAALQDRINFGLGVFTGTGQADSNQCPSLASVPMARDNYPAVFASYPTDRLKDSKLESPAPEILPALPPLFASAPGAGEDIVIFVTAGEPDFCDDENTICPIDATIAAIQALSEGGISTYVVGAPSAYVKDACPGVLQSYADAGAGLGVASPCPGRNYYAECNGNASWRGIATEKGRGAGQSLADYGTASGSKVYSFTDADQTALRDILSSMVPLKDCILDVGSVLTPGMVSSAAHCQSDPFMLPQQFSEMTVLIGEGAAARPYTQGGGWHVVSSSQIQLDGQACAQWQQLDTSVVQFIFQCWIG